MAAKTSAARNPISGTEAAVAAFAERQHPRIGGQFAQFAETASRGVSLQGMHGTTDTADGLRIAGRFFQLQRLLVERLHDFLRALEEQFPDDLRRGR